LITANLDDYIADEARLFPWFKRKGVVSGNIGRDVDEVPVVLLAAGC